MGQLKLIHTGKRTTYTYFISEDEKDNVHAIHSTITIDNNGEVIDIDLTGLDYKGLPPKILIAECHSLLYLKAEELSKEAKHKKEYRQKIDDFGGAKERDVDTKIVVETDKENIRIRPFSPLPAEPEDYVSAIYSKDAITNNFLSIDNLTKNLIQEIDGLKADNFNRIYKLLIEIRKVSAKYISNIDKDELIGSLKEGIEWCNDQLKNIPHETN